MLRQFVMWFVAAAAVGCVMLMKVVRTNEMEFVLLGLAAVFAGLFLYIASTPGPARSGDRASPFRLIGLWMKAKERDLQARIDKP